MEGANDDGGGEGGDESKTTVGTATIAAICTPIMPPSTKAFSSASALLRIPDESVVAVKAAAVDGTRISTAMRTDAEVMVSSTSEASTPASAAMTARIESCICKS